MCVVVALGVFAVSLTLGGCSPYSEGTYVEAPPSALRHPIKASAVKASPLPVRKPREPTKASSVKPPLPVRKHPEATEVSSLKPPPLPLRKPSQAQSPMPPSLSASVRLHGAVDEGRQEVEARFKTAQAKAKLSGVHTLTQEDIKGLSPEQIKELRGY
jgi:hypothetical protein